MDFTLRGIRLRRSAYVTVGTAALVLAGGLTAVTPAQAAWSAPCSYSTCEGKNPTIGCDKDPNLRTLDFKAPSVSDAGQGSVDADVQLRYSPGCDAFWARGVGYSDGVSGGCNTTRYQYARLQTQTYGGQWYPYATYSKDIKTATCSGTSRVAWTLMGRAGTGYRARICRANNQIGAGSGPSYACSTLWFTKS